MHRSNLKKNIILALKAPKLDTSDFILLAVRLLETELSFEDDAMKIIRQDYFQQDYDKAIGSIIKLANQRDLNLGKFLIDIKSNLHDSPYDNVSRRFYESLYAQKLEKKNKEFNEFSAFQELSVIFKSLGGYYSQNNSIDDFDEAQELISEIAQLNDDIEMTLKKGSRCYKQKDVDRGYDDKLISKNPGIMKPTSPNYPDNLIPEQTVEKKKINEKIENGYSKSRPAIPFVGSISGSAFTLAALLDKYIDTHMNDTEFRLKEKVNRIVNLFISFYINEGYHSYKEMTDVLNEPIIQSIFNKKNISLDLGAIETHDVFRQAQDYAMRIAQRSRLHAQLTNIVPEIEDITNLLPDKAEYESSSEHKNTGKLRFFDRLHHSDQKENSLQNDTIPLI